MMNVECFLKKWHHFLKIFMRSIPDSGVMAWLTVAHVAPHHPAAVVA
jgi:hypothetical protein